MVGPLPNNDMIATGVVIVLTIVGLLWQVLRSISGGVGPTGAVRLFCSLLVFGIMLYVGYSVLSMWT